MSKHKKSFGNNTSLGGNKTFSESFLPHSVLEISQNEHKKQSKTKKLEKRIEKLEAAIVERDIVIHKLKKKSKKILDYNNTLEDSKNNYQLRTSQILQLVEKMSDDLDSEKNRILQNNSFSFNVSHKRY